MTARAQQRVSAIGEFGFGGDAARAARAERLPPALVAALAPIAPDEPARDGPISGLSRPDMMRQLLRLGRPVSVKWDEIRLREELEWAEFAAGDD